MFLAEGTPLGPYRIDAPIGAGGMGFVYRAVDTRLDRVVAIKIVKAGFSERFQREAKTIAALNHPLICAVHDIGVTPSGENYLVMEFVEGRPPKGPLPLSETLRIGRLIGEALDAAHRKGIAHRDLKPANVLVTKTGVKLLDFGLAKFTARASEAAANVVSADAPTQSKQITAEHSIVGTIPYMAPELLEGKEADARSDIFALGCVLYELITGVRAFKGSSQASLIAKIMSADPPPLSTQQTPVPPAVETVIRKALAKDPADRWQSAHDMAETLALVSTHSGVAPLPATVETSSQRRGRLARRWLWPGLTAAFAIAAIYFGLRPGGRGERSETARPKRTSFEIVAPPGEQLQYPFFSPDGRLLIYGTTGPAGPRQWLRDIETGSVQPLAAQGSNVAWSPDGRFLAFSRDKGLYSLDLKTNREQLLCECPSQGSAIYGHWGANGEILYPHADGRIHGVASGGGGTTRPLTERDKSTWFRHAAPRLLPDGKRFLYVAGAADESRDELRVALLDAGPAAAPLARLPIGSRLAGYIPAGNDAIWLVLAPGTGLEVRRLNLASLVFDGDPRPLAKGDLIASASFGDGAAAYILPRPEKRRVALLRRDGTLDKQLGDVRDWRNLRLSPDGAWAVATVREKPGGNFSPAFLWMINTASGASSKFTDQEWVSNLVPAWTPDSQSVLYHSGSDRIRAFLVRKGLHAAAPEKLLEVPQDQRSRVEDVSPDGRFAALLDARGIQMVPLGPAAGGMFLFQETRHDERLPRFSPDGRWIFHTAREGTGSAQELFAQDFSGSPGASRNRFQLTHGGAGPYCFVAGGQEIAMQVGRRIVVLPVRISAGSVTAGEAKTLFTLDRDGALAGVHPDGRLLMRLDDEVAPQPITVVMNPLGGIAAHYK